MVFFFWVCVVDKTRCGFWSIILPIIFETVSKIWVFFYFLIQSWIQFYPEHTGFPIVGGGGKRGAPSPPPSYNFFQNSPLPIKTDAPQWGTSPLKNEAPFQLTNNPPLKSEGPFQEIISRKNPEKLETVINTCASFIKHRE